MTRRRSLVALAVAAALGFPGCPAHQAAPPATTAVVNEADCRITGSHICGTTIYFAMGDGSIHAYELTAPNRPGCFVEPSTTPEGYEVIFYGDIAGHGDTPGFEVVCPT